MLYADEKTRENLLKEELELLHKLANPESSTHHQQ